MCGAGGFIGGHLVERLKEEGYYVVGVDRKRPEFRESAADGFRLRDLTLPEEAKDVVNLCAPATSLIEEPGPWDEVYQLAADMGGMGFISAAELDIMTNSARINQNVFEACAVKPYPPRLFFSSSVCVFPDQHVTDFPRTEIHAYPANPDNEYGWEKLYAERLALCYARHTDMEVRIGRFQNTYGPYGTWCGGREKAPAALCRKIAEAEDGGEIEVWGDGRAVRCYTYIDDLIDGIRSVMNSDYGEPVIIGSDVSISVDDLALRIAAIAGKRITIKHIDGPVGVAARKFDKATLKSLGWKSRCSLDEGLAKTYAWVEEQVDQTIGV